MLLNKIIKRSLGLAVLAGLLVFPSAVSAESARQVVFPAGSSFGMVPFEGSKEAKEFSGFADVSDNRSVLIAELPLDGWAEISAAFKDRDILKQRGIDARTIEGLEISGREAIRLSGTQSVQGLTVPKCILIVKGKSAIGMFTAQMPQATDPDINACELIKGVAERSPISTSDQLAALPFTLADLGGMRIVDVLASSGAVLTHGELDIIKLNEQPIAIVVSSLRPSAAGQDQAAFAENALKNFGNFDFDGPFVANKLTIDDKPAVALEATAVDSKSKNRVRLVQWMLFSDDGNYLRMIGVSTVDQWAKSHSMFEKVRDGIDWSK